MQHEVRLNLHKLILLFNDAQQAKQTATSGKAPLAHEVEGVVRQRVAEELNRIREQQEETNNRITAQLSKQNLESKHNAVAINADIEDMIKRIQRYDVGEGLHMSQHTNNTPF
jgi:hypothetical protein